MSATAARLLLCQCHPPSHPSEEAPMPPPPSATYERLREFIAERMRHIYQLLMLMELLGRRSPALAQDVTRRILASAWWAGFTFNGITAYGDGHDSLIGGVELSDGERDALRELCRQRLDTFREQRGDKVFAHRSTSTSAPWRATTSSPRTRAAPTPSATCRRTASAATPASATAVCLRKRAHRLPLCAVQLRPPRSGLCVLHAGGQRPGAAGEQGAQPGDPASTWGQNPCQH